MNKRFFFVIMVLLCTACAATPVVTPTLTATTVPPMATITPTVIWFPPTPTHTAFPTPVITPTADMRPQLGELLFKDDFSDPKAWQLSQSSSGNIAMGTNELTIAIGENNAYLYSLREEPIFTDFYLEITASPSLCRDLDEYGVLFRVSPSVDYYRFSLACNGQVRLDRVIAGQASSPQPWLPSGVVPPGAPSSSRIGIAANGSNMDFFVNGQYQFSIKDPLLTSGALGLFARSTNKMAVTINFSDLELYSIVP
ncbi:MAG TPA: hypothetical protein VLD65_09855 [Anaerolineales bacterium]|nr:hypothetical protein [Anaerolineales bacterium]